MVCKVQSYNGKKMIRIRPAIPNDLKELVAIFDYARHFMRQCGNPVQWIDGYPSEELILQEINDKHCFVCEDERNELLGTFCYIAGNDPTYACIEEGEWLNNEPYAVIHRMASNGKVKGISDICLQWCFDKGHNIRVDTHEDNTVMQAILIKNGFQRCGIIYVENGTARIAFQTNTTTFGLKLITF